MDAVRNNGISEMAAAEGRRLSAVVRRARAAKRAAELAPIINDVRATGATSLRNIAAALNERGILTARGKPWSSVQVYRVLASLG